MNPLNTLLILIFIAGTEFGLPENTKIMDLGYVAGFETCRTESIPYVKELVANDERKIELYMASCLELTEEEMKSTDDAVNAAQKIYGNLRND